MVPNPHIILQDYFEIVPIIVFRNDIVKHLARRGCTLKRRFMSG